MAWACATFVTDEVLTVSQVFNYSTVLTGVFAAVAGILLFTSEVQHGTLAPTLAAQPARSAIVASKTLLAAAFGAVLGAAGLIASIGVPWSAASPQETRHRCSLPACGQSCSPRWPLCSAWESASSRGMALLPSPVSWCGGSSSRTCSRLSFPSMSPASCRSLPATERSAFRRGAESTSDTLGAAQDALIFGGYAAVALIVGTVLFHRRDAS